MNLDAISRGDLRWGMELTKTWGWGIHRGEGRGPSYENRKWAEELEHAGMGFGQNCNPRCQWQ